jgi:hypothetical protein
VIDDYPYEASWLLPSLTTGAVAAASGFNEVTKLGNVLSQSAGLALGDEYELAIVLYCDQDGSSNSSTV